MTRRSPKLLSISLTRSSQKHKTFGLYETVTDALKTIHCGEKNAKCTHFMYTHSL